MRAPLTLGCLTLMLGTAVAQVWNESHSSEASINPVLAQGLEALKLKVNPEFATWSPSYVCDRCGEFLVSTVLTDDGNEVPFFPECDRYRIRFFDLSGVPRDQLPSQTAALFHAINSTSSAPISHRPRPVPGTDNRLYWCDMEWYCWTPEAWEKVSRQDPYFREPIVSSMSDGLKIMKRYAPNGVIRGDWFTFYDGDASLFLKDGATQADDAIYYSLLYATSEFTRKVKEKVTVEGEEQVWVPNQWGNGGSYQWQKSDKTETKTVTKKVRGRPPKNAKEFQQYWHVDLKLLNDFPIDKGAVIDEGESIVAFQNRVLWRVRTGLGVYWRTFDVIQSVANQDFVEYPFPFPKKFNAGEHIVQDAKGAQFYFLTNGVDDNGKNNDDRVEFGDPRIVHDRASGQKDIIITYKSCVACHQQGIIPFKNEIPSILNTGADLRLITPEKARRVEDFYLQNLNRLVHQDQDEYNEFTKDTTGLEAAQASEQYTRARAWYIKPLTLEQCARELGSDIRELSDALGYQVTKGRLGRLVLDGKPIPRTTWEQGGYAETGLLLINWRKRNTIPGR